MRLLLVLVLLVSASGTLLRTLRQEEMLRTVWENRPLSENARLHQELARLKADRPADHLKADHPAEMVAPSKGSATSGGFL